MTAQLSFDLPVRPALSREDFFVAPGNALAVALIDGWESWSGAKMALTGPEGAGKTHLAHVWAALSGAHVIAAQDVTEAAVPELATHNLVIEDVPQIAGDTAREAALFHLHNLALAQGRSLLFTGRGPLAHWPLTLPDLKSRMQGATEATLSSPDDALLAAVLAKHFADRQLRTNPDLIAYLVARINRSFAAAADVAAQLDRAALAAKRPVTRALAREVLET